MVKVAIMGHGVVGSGVTEVLIHNHDSIAEKAADSIEIKYVLDLRPVEGPLADRWITDFATIENDDEVSIVVETMGGLKPAYDFVKRCLSAGKSVVTSNKELVAAKGVELLNIARERNLNFMFEASVGGGIPIIRPIQQCLAGNHILEIRGILNGTTNYILTSMVKNGVPFDDALAKAQQLGYAERDPSADIDGLDACRKICILASLAYGRHVYPEQVYTEGIRNITLDDVKMAEKLGYVIKLIGRSVKLTDNSITATVYPALVPQSDLLSNVDDVFNAIMVRGDAIGDAVFYGRGAGKLPTASAVVADVIDCVKHVTARKYMSWEDGFDGYVVDHNCDCTRLFVVTDTQFADKVSESFSDCETVTDGERLAFITDIGKFGALTEKIKQSGIETKAVYNVLY
ncbi:MAG: homoserine dehydrogenase [Firmicutes bacterium]|nr:homoserine dehydrogenase [Bacillota bacterium]